MFSLPYPRGTGISLLIMVWTMCSSLLFLSRFSFRPTNFVFVSFSFLYSNLIVSLFLLVKPDLTSHMLKIIHWQIKPNIYLYFRWAETKKRWDKARAYSLLDKGILQSLRNTCRTHFFPRVLKGERRQTLCGSHAHTK